MYIKIKYKTPNYVRTKGKIYLDNPNIVFGTNITLHQGVHFFGHGKIILCDNVSIGKDTIIFAAEEVYIDNDTSIAAK